MTEQLRFAMHLLNNLPGMAYRCESGRPWEMSFVSGGCETLCGRSAKFLKDAATGWTDLIHADDLNTARQAIKAALKEGHKFDIQYRITDIFGQLKWVREQGYGVPSERATQPPIEGFISDLTAAKNLALDLAGTGTDQQHNVLHRHEQLAHADRVITLGEMATGIAHEINQPLTAISLFAQTGRRLNEAGEHDRLKDIFDKLSQHARRAGAIVERVQGLARSRSSAKQVINLNALISDIVGLAEIDARTSDIVIQLNLATEPMRVNVDVIQIQQVTLNLLRNSIDAMRPLGCQNGNTIEISTRKLEDGFLEVAVRDSGCGVPDEVAESLFDSFATTKITGLGMGLPISKAIVAAHGGQITFQNNKTSGATFSFTLPASANGDQHG